MKRIAILRWNKLPSFVTWEIPNVNEFLADDELLIKGFNERGFEAESIVWNQPDIDWNTFDAALIRSTWDYIDDKTSFLDVLSEIEASPCKLFNPLDAVRWNIDKNYLFDLKKSGIPIVPTYSISDFDPADLHEKFIKGKWKSAILKPTLGGGGANSHRVTSDELDNLLRKLMGQNPGHDYLLQPFVESVVTEGEWSFIYFNRKLSHVLLKKPASNEYRVQSIYGGTAQIVEPKAHDLSQVNAIMEQLPFDLLYARLDLVRVNGNLAVMEVELIEPVLSFSLFPAGVRHLVKATELFLDN